MGEYLGQHFLKNEKALETIIAGLALQPGETIIEIGPGAGALTLPLLAAATEKKCTVFAIEKDVLLAKELADARHPNVNIITGDALIELPKLATNITTNWKLVGNIPYYITGALLRLIGELSHKPSISVLMIQKEVAERVSATTPKMNLLSAATQIWAKVEILQYLKPKDFEPAPKVDSAIISLVPHQTVLIKNLDLYYKTIHTVFKQPRKTLLNNLSSDSSLSKEEITSQLKKIGLAPTLRGQNVSIEQLIELSSLYTQMQLPS